MEEQKPQETIIKDSNVEILIENGVSNVTDKANKETDYWSLLIIVLIFLGIAAYFLWARHVPQKL